MVKLAKTQRRRESWIARRAQCGQSTDTYSTTLITKPLRPLNIDPRSEQMGLFQIRSIYSVRPDD